MRRVWLPLVLLAAVPACRRPGQPDSARIDPALAAFVPVGTLLLVDTRLEGADSLQATPAYQKYLSGLPLPQLEEFSRRTGLDPRKDIAELLFCSDGKQGVLIGRGHFQPEALESKLAAEGASRIDYKGHHLLGTETVAAVFVSSSVAMTGYTPMLRAMLDLNGHGSPPEWLAALVRTIPAGPQLWAAYGGGVLRLPFPENSNLGNLNRLARSIESGVFYVDLRQGIDLTVNGMCSDEAAAKQVHDAVKGFIGMGRLSTPDNKPELLRLYDSFQVDQKGSGVTLNAKIPLELVDQFFKAFTK